MVLKEDDDVRPVGIVSVAQKKLEGILEERDKIVGLTILCLTYSPRQLYMSRIWKVLEEKFLK